MGEELETLPDNIISVDWPYEAFKKNLRLSFEVGGQSREVPLLDCSIDLADDQQTPDAVEVIISDNYDFTYRVTYSFETDRLFEPAVADQIELCVVSDNEAVPIVTFLNEYPLEFYTDDLSRIFGFNILREQDGYEPLDSKQLITKPWQDDGVDIRNEFEAPTGRGISLQQHLAEVLGADSHPCEIAYCDHGTGEIADFIAIERQGEKLLVQMYHCKKSSDENPGHRVNDVYEVTSQSVKNIKWAKKQLILKQVRYRFQNQKGESRFVKGTLERFEELLGDHAPAQIDFEMVVVQPGIQKEGLPQALQNNLASASDFLVRGGNFKPLSVWCS